MTSGRGADQLATSKLAYHSTCCAAKALYLSGSVLVIRNLEADVVPNPGLLLQSIKSEGRLALLSPDESIWVPT